LKICIITFFSDLLRKDTGPTVRIYNLAKGLTSIGHEVNIIIPWYKRTYRQVDGLHIYYINGVLPRAILRALSKLLGVARPSSFFLYDLFFILRIGRIIRESHIVQIEEQEAGLLLIPIISTIFRKRVVVDCHDVLQALRIKHTSRLRTILETFSEKMAYKYSSAILAVSENERDLLVSYGVKKDKIWVIPNGVDTEAFNPSINADRVKSMFDLRKYRTVIFVGNIDYPPNLEAVRMIASKIAPQVRKRIKNVKFLIIGRASKKINVEGLIFTGVVDNVAEYLASADVAIAPLFHGSGTRLKILEYFSSGLPVISTSLGVKGLNVKKNVHALIEDDVNKFAVRIIELLKNKALATNLGKAGRKLVIDCYDWKKIIKFLSEVYSKIIYL